MLKRANLDFTHPTNPSRKPEKLALIEGFVVAAYIIEDIADMKYAPRH
jgi:hypothetical protein